MQTNIAIFIRNCQVCNILLQFVCNLPRWRNGRRVRFRTVWGNPWRFDSSPRHKSGIILSRAEVVKLVYLPAGRQARKISKMYYVYILKSLKTGEFYKGLTDNLDRRLNQHLSEGSKTTKSKLPLELVHVEICKTREEARKFEKFFKSGYGREIIKEIAEVVKLVYTQD